MRSAILSLATATTIAFLTAPLAAQPVALSPVYRLLAVGSNDHVYTIDANEANVLTQQGTHTYEGVVFRLFATPQPGMRPVYRYVTGNGTHLLDTQRPAHIDPFARLEATLGYVSGPGQGLVPLYVWTNPRLGLSFYTAHPQGEFAAQNGYVNQGILGYVAPGG